MTPKDLPELTDVQASQNTDREVWRETPGDVYSNSVHLTATGGLGINVGGTVYVKPPAEWHRLASGARSTAIPRPQRVHDAIREVGKWLNERPNRPIDLESVAILCAEVSRSTAAQPLTLSHEEIDRVFNEHEEAPQISYRYWVANALLAAANEKSPTAAAQPPGWVDEAAGQIEHLDRENNRLAREAWTWSKACEAATRKLHILSTHHPRLEVRYWTGSYWEPMYGVALDRLLETLAPAPPAATGDSTPPSEPAGLTDDRIKRHTLRAADCPPDSKVLLVSSVRRFLAAQGDPSGALRPEPEAVDRERGVR